MGAFCPHCALTCWGPFGKGTKPSSESSTLNVLLHPKDPTWMGGTRTLSIAYTEWAPGYSALVMGPCPSVQPCSGSSNSLDLRSFPQWGQLKHPIPISLYELGERKCPGSS
jgi:hypothetical protein